MTPEQMTMPLRVHQRTALVTVETARAVLGLDAESIYAMVESGRIRWAWNIAVNPSAPLREIRIWAREFIAPAPDLDELRVINAVIGTGRDRLGAVEISNHVLLCSRPHMAELVRVGELSGELVGHTRWIQRDSLASFLSRRLVG